MRILVISGASGGHIFPALAFLAELKQRQPQINACLVLPKAAVKNSVADCGFNIEYLSIVSLGLRPSWKNFLRAGKFIQGAIESFCLLSKFSPDIVVGFGSLVCLPMLFGAWFLRIKTVVHEQNVIPGRANRLFFPFADNIAVSFSQTQRLLLRYKDKVFLSGNPLRKSLTRIDKYSALNYFGLDNLKFTILVMGGSQGSHNISNAFLKAVALLSTRERLQIIHLSRDKDYSFLKEAYQALGLQFRLFRFFGEMQYAYSCADLVIARAGAGTIAELIFYALPAVLVPYPYARQHQLANAQVLERRGAAFIIEEHDLSEGLLRVALEEFINHPARLQAMRNAYSGFSRFDASTALLDKVLTA
jgi:UDP-N-acetylglucosamine--N-acetylmuramyl-(pentapeptide) pyrophosphoryl-undecaprenol N-acetylglucosamine transferase